MPVALAVLLAAGLAALAVWLLSRRPGAPNPADPATEERWLVGWLLGHPRLGRAARSVDRRVAGGLLLVVVLVVVFASAFAVGLLLDMVDRGTGLARFDRGVADWGSRHATSDSTRLLDRVTNLGGTGYLVVIVAAIAVVDYIRRRNPNVPLFIVVVVAGVTLMNNGLKLIIDRERPDVPHLVGASGSSFPSGHSAAAAAAWFALALVVSRHWPRQGRAVATALATVVAVAVAASRALLGVHWLTDVVAGLIVGWAWFLLVALVFGGRLQRLGRPVERVAAASRPEGSIGPEASGGDPSFLTDARRGTTSPRPGTPHAGPPGRG